jgi:hypothetical protein
MFVSLKMLLVQIVFYVISCIPFGIWAVYVVVTAKMTKSSEKQAIEGLVSTIMYLLINSTFADRYKQIEKYLHLNILRRVTWGNCKWIFNLFFWNCYNFFIPDYFFPKSGIQVEWLILYLPVQELSKFDLQVRMFHLFSNCPKKFFSITPQGAIG